MSEVVLELLGVTKAYGGLRPLRVTGLTVIEGEQVAIVGLDQPAAEVLVNLITGATVPDAGTVHVFGRPTTAITDSVDWFKLLDRFGITADRAVLMDGFSVIQNLSMPLSLEVEPPGDAIRARAVSVAREVELDPVHDDQPVGGLDGPNRARVRLGRALALEPSVLLLEHPSATLAGQDTKEFGELVRRVAEVRGVAAVTLTADATFADTVAARVLHLEAGTGRLAPKRRGWFAR